MENKVLFYAVGDVCPERVERGQEPESMFRAVQPTLKEADIRFCQLETALSKKGRLQGARYSGQNPRMDPKNVTALTYAGFDVISCATNCNMNWGEDALVDTLELLRKSGIKPIGAGKDIAEARQPAIIEKNGVRVALLSYCTVLPPGFAAEPDKAGCTPLHIHTFYEASEYQPGNPAKIITIPFEDELAAMLDDIKKAKAQADIVILSLHWGLHFNPKAIAMYQPIVGHAAIDAGVDLIIGTHAHILKAAEVYKGKVIFYSIGNFGFDLDPKLISGTAAGRHLMALYNWKLDPEYPTYPYPPDTRKTIIVKALLSKKGVEKVSFLPAYICKPNQPEVMPKSDERFAEVVKYMEWASEGFDVKFVVKGDEVLVQSKEKK